MSTNQKDTNDSSTKLQSHLKLLKNEYAKLQKNYNELEKKFNEIQANSDNISTAADSSFNSRLVVIVASLHGRKTYSDLTIKLKDEQSFSAHKFVLSARSEEWREEVLADVTELDWSDLDIHASHALLRWIYTDIVDLNQQDSLSINLLKAAHRFKLNGLMGLCERALISTVNIRSCVAFYCAAEEVGASNLLEYSSSLISIHWDELLPQDFIHMSETLLYKMLKSKTKFPLHAAIRLQREDVVFLCLVENEGTDIVNSLSPQDQLPLGIALIEQNTAIATTLINGNANVNAINSEGATLLIDAVKRSDGFSANFLLENNCDVNLITKDTGDTALHIICTYSKESSSIETYREMLEIGKIILSKNNLEVNKQNFKGYSALHLALISGHGEIINELLKYPEINLNLLTNDGKCALLLSLLSHQFTDFSVARCLIEHGAETNYIDDNGDNILQFLIKSQKEDVAVFMCDFVNLNYKNYDNLTSLHLASKYGLVNLIKKLLLSGASPNIQTGIEEMKTALHYAIESNYIDVVQAFVDFKVEGKNKEEMPDFNLRCANGDTPLSLALSLRHNDLVPVLIRGGSDVNARKGELTLLHQAILKESAETAIFLLEQGADVNTLTGEQESPLELAIHCRLESVVDALCSRGVSLASPNILWSALESEQENIASVLVKHGIDTDCWSLGSDGLLQTFLHRAIDDHNEHAAIFLIRSGCDIDSPRQSPSDGDVSPTTTKESPLHLCCIYGLAKVAQTLIEHECNVNSLNSESKTPLHHAIQYQHEAIISILLRHPNIDLKQRDKQGNTPFATALTVRNHKAAEKILDRMPTAAEVVDSRGRNFLHLAIMREDLESVLFLISIAVDVNSRVHDVNQATPLMLASTSENEMLIRNLILAGARLNDRDSTQKTALHIGAERGRLCAVQALLQNGCDYDVLDAEGNNALHIAMRESMLPIVRELLTESRINAEIMNMKGRNPLHELCRSGRDSLAASICELFLECMPNYPINQPDLLGNTPLLLAYMRGETQLCRVLVKSGACLGAENKDGVSIFNYKLATNQLLYRLLDELSVESPWSSSDLCQECATKFSLTMRKHHCRHCGRQICSQCSNNDVPIIKFGINKPVRVCRICFDVLQIGSHT